MTRSARHEQEVSILQQHEHVQMCKVSIACAMREFQEKREQLQQYKRRRVGDGGTL